MVLNPTEIPNAHKSKKLDELASQLGEDAEKIRQNEGEAANYGVYFDDSSYDYMQHLREIGGGGGEAVFVESSASLNKDKAKLKQPLSEALKQMDLRDRSEDLLDEDILPSKNLQRVTYQNQQDVPDVIAGFKPDMDPRLREVLEALEDEEYVDEEDDDLFKELAKDGEEIDKYEFEDTYSEQGFDDDDDGWESDATERPAKAHGDQTAEDEESEDRVPDLVDTAAAASAGGPPGSAPQPSGAWMEDFNQFKKDQTKTRRPIVPAMSEIQSSIWTTTTSGGRKKKRKGALTQQSGFSMTSSSLVRTEQLTLLDARFEKIDEEYNDDMDDMKSVSAFSSASSVQGPMRADFDNIMDDFLDGYTMQGKRSIRKGRPQTGIEQLEEIRRGLGPARLSTRRK